MKKILMSALVTALMIAPLGIVATAENVEAPLPQLSEEQSVSGEAPAELGISETMSPAFHGMVMAMLNHDVKTFDSSNAELAWESLYNMLSLYGQMDMRSEYQGEDLLLVSETVADYAGCFLSDRSVLDHMPDSIQDRMQYLPEADSYLVTCGEDGLSSIRMNTQEQADGSVLVNGEFVYDVDGSLITGFTAKLTPADNMFGWNVASFELN